jgi:hydroxymethylbilane synthase
MKQKKEKILKNKFIIGSRGSDLALWQANFIKGELEKNNGNISVEIKIIKTKGDKITDVALSKIGDKSLFTKELENELLGNNIDIAVHSLKDLQTRLPKGLKLAAVTKRHPVEDVLIAKEKNVTIKTIRKNGIVATGSLRRRSQLLNLRPDINVVELRGNVPRRIEKFLESDWDAIILARAGVERLGLEKNISSFISKNEILPAVGQGALGIEIRESDKDTEQILQPIHDQETLFAVLAERSLLRTLEGGCQVPIGIYSEIKSGELYLEAYVGSVNGKTAFRDNISGKKEDAEKLGMQLADKLLDAGAKEILDEIFKTVRIK